MVYFWGCLLVKIVDLMIRNSVEENRMVVIRVGEVVILFVIMLNVR